MAQFTVSINELTALATKVAQHFGFRWGADADVATLVGWLEINRLHGLARLQRLAERGRLNASVQIDYRPADATSPSTPGDREKTGASIVDAGTVNGRQESIANFALPVADFLHAQVVLKRVTAAGMALSIVNATDGIFLLAAAGCKLKSHCARLETYDGEQKLVATVSTDEVKIRTSAGPAPIKTTLEFSNGHLQFDTFLADSSTRHGDADTPTATETISPRENQKQALRHGIAVDVATWQALQGFAKKLLVPESEFSRKFGTGGGDAND